MTSSQPKPFKVSSPVTVATKPPAASGPAARTPAGALVTKNTQHDDAPLHHLSSSSSPLLLFITSAPLHHVSSSSSRPPHLHPSRPLHHVLLIFTPLLLFTALLLIPSSSSPLLLFIPSPPLHHVLFIFTPLLLFTALLLPSSSSPLLLFIPSPPLHHVLLIFTPLLLFTPLLIPLLFIPSPPLPPPPLHQVSVFQAPEGPVLEVGELEGDTLDPQTGLFYRSSRPASDPVRRTPHPGSAQPPPSGRVEAEPSRLSSASTQPPLQLFSKPQVSQPSSSSSSSSLPLTKKLPKLREQGQPKAPAVTLTPKDRPPAAPAHAGAKVTTPGALAKPPLTLQLPKLQQAPTSQHRPLHSAMSHPPPCRRTTRWARTRRPPARWVTSRK